MAKYISGRSKLTPQTGLSSDRYRYLSVSESEPNLGDPLIGPSAYLDNLPPAGNQYIVIGVDGYPGERYWIPNQGGIIPGSITIFDDGDQVGGLSSTTQLDFVGNSVVAEGIGGINPGFAVTITVAPPGNNNSVLFKNNDDFATDLRFTFDDGLFAAGDRITVGTGGTVITTTGIGSVGIGTTDPTQKLHLDGDFRITGTIYDSLNQPGDQGDLIVKDINGGLLWVRPNSIVSGAGGTIGQVQFHNTAGLVDGGDNFYYDFNNNRVGIGSTIPTQLLDVLGVSTFSGGVFVDNLTVSGVSTFTELVDANGGIDATTLNVSGLSTFLSNVDMNAGLDVDGTTDLDDLNVSETASFTDTTDNTPGNTNTGAVQVDGGVGIDKNLTVGMGISAQNLYITGVGTIAQFDFGIGEFDNIIVTGVSTLGNVVIGVNSISTKPGTGNLTIDSDGLSSVVVKDTILLQKDTESTTTDSGALQVDGGIGVNKSVNIGGNLNVTGDGVGQDVILASAGGITTTGGDLYVGGDLFPSTNGTLDLGGTSNIWDKVYANTFVGAITGSATSLAGGAAGSLPYQSATDTTTFLAEPNADGKILSYYNTTNAPIWIDQSIIETTQASNAQLTADTAVSDAAAAQSTADTAVADAKTYTLTAVDSESNVILRLKDSDNINDDVLITAGFNITIDSVEEGGFTIAAVGSDENFANNSGSSVTLNPTSATVFRVGLTVASTTINIAEPTQIAGKASAIQVFVDNQSTNNGIIIWNNSKSGGTIKFPSGITPSRSTGTNEMDLWVFNTFDNGTTWYGLISVYNYQT